MAGSAQSHSTVPSTRANISDSSESLAAAFDFFNETSAQLTRSYKVLENKINQLTCDLDRVSAEKDEEHLKKEQIASRMRALLDVLPGGVIVLDSHGYIIQCNPAAQRLLDHSLQGSLWRSVIGECFAPRNDDGLEVSTKAGRRISVATSSLDADNSSGGGQIILLTDLTETRQLQHNLSRNERLSAMGKMVSALAHQVRTPLSAAILYAGHLCNPQLSEDKRSAFSQKILSRLHHMERQVRDMLLFVKTELPLNDVINLNDLSHGVNEAIEVLLHSSGVECCWRILADSKTEIKCHREALISAIVNLVNNALQAKRAEHIEKPYITFQLQHVEGGLSVSIIDRGPGINKKNLDRLQEIFVTTKPQGTGLGLAVVKAVARAHGGLFDMHSQEGVGTTASIVLPIIHT